MKMIVAIIQPQQLEDMKIAIQEAGFQHLTCTNILGTSANRYEEYKYRGVTEEISLFHKVRLEVAVEDEAVKPLLSAMSAGARASGGIGLAFVTELYDVVRLGDDISGEVPVSVASSRSIEF